MSDLLKNRLGPDAFFRRKQLEDRILHSGDLLSKQRRGAKRPSHMVFLKWLLRMAGLYPRAFHNYLDIQVVKREVFLPTLPLSFDGFRILQLSDLHFTLSEDFLGALLCKLRAVTDEIKSCDIVVLTGDYCAYLGRHHARVLQELKQVLDVLGLPCWGVLGNYDCLELVPALEQYGVRFLLNEHDKIQQGRECLFLCGVDDPVLFRTQDLERARHGIPEGECAILLAHSPEVWKEAAALDYSLLLAGHTHGGQICFPGRRPIVNKTNVKHSLMRGAWREGRLLGYTSSGTGASQLPVRLNCPAEITIHTLRRL